jgi:hypothetical protein
MDRAWSKHPEGGQWLEQTAINFALAMDYAEVCRLPRRYNLIAQQGRINSIYCRGSLRDVVNVHCCAMQDADQIASHHQRLLDYIYTGQAGRDRIDWLYNLPKGSTGAELGVFRGDFSKEILRIVQPSALHLVDLFEGEIVSVNQDGRAMRCVEMETVLPHLTALGHPVQTWKSDSIAWLNSRPAHSLDWVYIDTAHDYATTIAELHAAARVVRPGGTIAGHDFSRAFEGVVKAVLEFVAATGAKCEIYDGDLLPSYSISGWKL